MRLRLRWLCVGALALAACGGASPGAGAPVAPAHPERLQAELATRIGTALAAARANPRDALAHAKLGLVYEANKLWSEARRCYENAAALAPDEVLWPLHAAMCALQGGEVEDARRLFVSAARRFPDCAPLQQRLGEYLLEAGPFEDALAAFRRTTKLAPDEPHGWVGQGDALIRSGRHAEAIEPLQRALALEPDYKLAHWLLGLAYRATGKSSAEVERELSAGRNAGRRFLGDVWSDRLREQVVGLEPGLERAVELLEAEQFAEAEAALEQLDASYPGELRVLSNLGVARARLRDFVGALAALDRALPLDKTSGFVQTNRAGCLLEMDKPLEALAAADEAVRVAPRSAQAHFMRGGVLLTLGERAPGLEEMREAARLDPNDAGIAAELRRAEQQP